MLRQLIEFNLKYGGSPERPKFKYVVQRSMKARRWTEEEDKELLFLVRSNQHTRRVIAFRMKRSVPAIYNRLAILKRDGKL